MFERQPNFLIVMADQLVPMMTGPYGSKVARTPNMDCLAERGITFENAYTSCPICAPARMSMLTGRYVSDVGCNDNTSILASDEPTFNHYLSAAGYDTVLSGKMHMVGPDQLHGYAKRLTTDIYPSDFTWLTERREPSGHAAFHMNPIAIDYVAEGVGVRQWSMQLDYDEETHFRALEYLRYKKSRACGTLQKPMPEPDRTPFCLHVSYQHPHEPFHCTRRHWDMYEGVDIPVPVYPDDLEKLYTTMDRQLNVFHGCGEVDLKNPDSLRMLHRAYLASVSYFDEKVGELLEALSAYGLADDTIVILLSDHGDMLGHRGMVQKRCFYEHSSRISLMFSFPANFPLGAKGARSADVVSIVDLLPTLLELAGVRDHLPTDGRSLVPQLRRERDPDRFVFCENHVEGVTMCCFMVRKGKYKYTYIHGGEAQLFDVEVDPGEWSNLCGRPELTGVESELRGLILNRFDPAAIDAEIEENLRKRRVVKSAMDAPAGPSWDFQPFFDATRRYWREG